METHGKRAIEPLTVVSSERGIRIWGGGVKAYFYFLFYILCLYSIVYIVEECYCLATWLSSLKGGKKSL